VPVEEGDTVATLQERIKVAERKIYPETIRKLMTKASRP
jgi:folate-dependent phosphoribosylglycinamide formyltransferase PurN